MDRIEKLSDTRYLNQIVKLHVHAFRGVLSGQIGYGFLYNYYKTILRKGCIFAYMNDQKVVGFISGTTDERLLNNFSFYWFAFLGMMIHIFRSSLYLSIRRHIKRLKNFKEINIYSELLSIAVDENQRGKGIGMKLVACLDDYFKSRDVFTYKVYTDTVFSTGYRLYEKLGFRLIKEVDLYNLPFRLYVKELEN